MCVEGGNPAIDDSKILFGLHHCSVSCAFIWLIVLYNQIDGKGVRRDGCGAASVAAPQPSLLTLNRQKCREREMSTETTFMPTIDAATFHADVQYIESLWQRK